MKKARIPPRPPPIFTFPASEFYDRPCVVVNDGARESFVDIGPDRIPLTAGERATFGIPRGADYLVGLGPKVRLVDTTHEGSL